MSLIQTEVAWMILWWLRRNDLKVILFHLYSFLCFMLWSYNSFLFISAKDLFRLVSAMDILYAPDFAMPVRIEKRVETSILFWYFWDTYLVQNWVQAIKERFCFFACWTHFNENHGRHYLYTRVRIRTMGSYNYTLITCFLLIVSKRRRNFWPSFKLTGLVCVMKIIL